MTWLAIGGAGHDHKWQEVILLGLGVTRTRRARPVDERRVARFGTRHLLPQPGIEGFCLRIGPAEATPEVVIGLPAADDQHAVLAQHPQRAPRRQMLGRIPAVAERELHRRDIGLPSWSWSTATATAIRGAQASVIDFDRPW